MDTSSLVMDEIDDTWKLLKQLVHDGFDVTIAFWVRFEFEEDGPWFYIVSKTVDQKGLQAAYRDVHATLHRIPTPWGTLSVDDMSELQVVGADDHFARDVLAFRDQYPGKNRFQGTRIGDRFIKELFICPPVTTSIGGDEELRPLTVELPPRIWEKLHALAAASSQAGTPPVSAGKLAADIIGQHVRDAPS